MRYLVLDRDTRTIKIRNRPSDPAVTQLLPSKADLRAGVRWDAWGQPWGHISNKVLHQVIYPARYARDRARGITGKKYMLWVPEPWLVALGKDERKAVLSSPAPVLGFQAAGAKFHRLFPSYRWGQHGGQIVRRQDSDSYGPGSKRRMPSRRRQWSARSSDSGSPVPPQSDEGRCPRPSMRAVASGDRGSYVQVDTHPDRRFGSVR
jgi:hypothetical protein